MAKLPIWGAEIPEPIAIKFCMPDAVIDVITHTNIYQIVTMFWRLDGSNFGLF